MLGYPGAGKTTAAKLIHDITGAHHLWADHERRMRFDKPTHSQQENMVLYDALNHKARALLEDGQSVVFDTNFNFYKDREHMRDIAKKTNAQVKLLWVQTPKEVAKLRATQSPETQTTRVLGNMPESEFERMAGNLKKPESNEQFIALDGTILTKQYIKDALGL